MTSPTTLVVTSTYYFNYINQNEVSWFDGKYLQDPTSRLARLEKEILAGWLNKLAGNIARHHSLDARIWENLAGLLQGYQDELGVIPKESEPGETFGITGVDAGVFAYLDRPATAVDNRSDVRLQNSRPDAPAMLLVDKDIAHQWGVHEHDVAVDGVVTLADIPFNGVIQRHDINGLPVPNADVWRTDELFTDKLYVVRQKDAFTGARMPTWKGNPPRLDNQEITLILPINDELLKHLTEDDLLVRTSFTQGADGEITITLKLTLSGVSEGKRIYEARRTYPRDNIVDYDQIPILEVFPNFSNDKWKSYYVAYSADKPKATFQVKPYSSDLLPKAVEIPLPGNPDAERRIWQLVSFPSAVSCYSGTEKAGFLILNQPRTDLPPANRHYTVGVDFGASGTCVYSSVDGNRETLDFKNHKLTVTNLDPTQSSVVFDFFLPNLEIKTPFLSFFQPFNNHGDAASLLPIVHGHTYYTDDSKPTGYSQNNIKTDLKWSNDDFERLCAQSFLTQICLQTVAELTQAGAATIDWEFSYPTAFADADAYQTTCTQLVAAVSALTGVESKNTSFKTESVAAAQFFREHQEAQTTLGTVFIDIGSSTSDVSVWQKVHDAEKGSQAEKLVWQISLRYAGRDLFLDYLYSHDDILKIFKFPSPAKGDGSPVDRKEFYAQIDTILRRDNDGVFALLPIAAARQEVKNLKQHLAVGLSGLFFYIGLGIRYLQENGIYQRAEMPHFYFGGNGSQIFRWLNNGTWEDGNVYSKLFNAVFTAALEQPFTSGVFQTKMSSLPKKEAAYGLVCGDILSVSEHNNIVVAGENFIENDLPIQWNGVLDSNRLGNTIDLPASLAKLTEFREAFNQFALTSNGQILTLDISAQQWGDIRGRVSTDLSDLARQRERQEPVIVQPIFIMALRHLLRV
jgi:hypothetical protein